MGRLGVSTMEWGVSEAIRTYGKIPDVIYDTGSIGKDGQKRIHRYSLILKLDENRKQSKELEILSYFATANKVPLLIGLRTCSVDSR